MNFHCSPQSDCEEVVDNRRKEPPRTCEEWLNSRSAVEELVSTDGTLFTSSNKGVKWPAHSSHLDFVVVPSHSLEEAAYEHATPGDMILGTKEDIRADLEKHAPWDSKLLRSIEGKLQHLQGMFHECANCFVCDGQCHSLKESVAGGLKNVCPPDRAFMTELGDELLSLRALTSRKLKHQVAKRNSTELSAIKADKDEIAELSTKTVQVEFPEISELHGSINVSLPGKLEALTILNLVNKCADIPSHLMKGWKRFFFCSMSASILQNTFWWMWLNYFKPDEELQALLFDQIADDFVLILIEMNDKHKDEIFMHYPVCLAQALYSTFCHAFPTSTDEFNTIKFLEYLNNTTSEWILGVKSQPQLWKHWPRHLLNPHFIQQNNSATVDQSQQLRRLGSIAVNEDDKHSKEDTDELDRNNFGLSNIRIRPGPTFECVQFSICGRSPLLQHCLHRHNLSEDREPRGPAVSRTQVKELPPPGVTYAQVIKAHTMKTEKLYKQYENHIAQTDQEIVQARSKHVAGNRRIEKQNKRILEHRHEVATLAEKLMASRKEDSI